jgi:hypothetical protein
MATAPQICEQSKAVRLTYMFNTEMEESNIILKKCQKKNNQARNFVAFSAKKRHCTFALTPGLIIYDA